jgi:hypothetical protein
VPQAQITVNAVIGSNDNVPIATLVQLGNNNTGGETTFLWSIYDQPPGPADNLSSTVVVNPTFTPHKEGTYGLQLIVNGTLENRVIVAVRQLKTLERVPAAGETTDDGARGWAGAVGSALQFADARWADPAIYTAVVGASAPVNGSVCYTSGTGVIKPGLPGQETLPIMDTASASVAADLAGLLFVCLGGVNGSGSPGVGTLAYFRLAGRVANVSDPGVVGNDVFVSNAALLSTTPGATSRKVGTVIAASGGFIDVMFSGSQPGLGAGAGAILANGTVPWTANQSVGGFGFTSLVGIANAGGGLSITAGGGSTWQTTAGSLTIDAFGALNLQGGAASAFSTLAGGIAINGFGGVNLQKNSTTYIDAGVTTNGVVTLAASTSLAGAAGTGALSFGSMTGATALPTGNLSWAGASGSTGSFVSLAAGITITAGGASVWSTSAGALTIDSFAVLNLGTGSATGIASGHGNVIFTHTGLFTVSNSNASTTTATDVATVQALSSGAAAAGFGVGVLFSGQDAGGSPSSMAHVQAIYTVATHASYAAKLTLLGATAAALSTTGLTVWGSGGTSLDVGAGVNSVDPGVGNTSIGNGTGNGSFFVKHSYAGSLYNVIESNYGSGYVKIGGPISTTLLEVSGNNFTFGTPSTTYVQLSNLTGVLGANDGNASAGGYTVRGTKIAGTNLAGPTMIFDPPLGTGTGALGIFQIQGSVAAAPGVGQHTLQAQLTIQGGVYVGSSVVDPGANNLTVQGISYLSGGVREAFRSIADTNATATTADRWIGYSSISAPRTVTLPGGAPAGTVISVYDYSGSASALNTITMSPTSGAVHGDNKIVTAYGRVDFVSDGTNWTGWAFVV